MRQDIFWKAKSDAEILDYFETMTADESQAFFDGYMALREQRICALNNRFWGCGAGNKGDLNFEPGSLEDLWAWAAKTIHREDLTEEERGRVKNMPDALRQFYRTRFTEETLILLNDIAYYLGEVVVRSLRGIEWTICRTKLQRYVDQNQPVLSGFSAPGYEFGVNPRSRIQVIASKAIDGVDSNEALLEVYELCYQSA